jgi:hypothetical protein
MAGKSPSSFHAFRDLVQLILGNTILANGVAVCLAKGPRTDAYVVGGYGRGAKTDPLALTDGRFLRLTFRLFLIKTDAGPRVKVEVSCFQYQLDKEGDHWVFRYDYVREPSEPHPYAHLHVRGALAESCLSYKQSLDDVHFPTNRVSLESVIRLLIEQFKVQSNRPVEIWRPLLAESEALFLNIAHNSISGPIS